MKGGLCLLLVVGVTTVCSPAVMAQEFLTGLDRGRVQNEFFGLSSLRIDTKVGYKKIDLTLDAMDPVLWAFRRIEVLNFLEFFQKESEQPGSVKTTVILAPRGSRK